MVRPRLVVVNAQSPKSQSDPREAPSFTERRSRPRHGTIKLIEDAVYRALREQGRRPPAQVPTFAPRTVSGPPTMVLYSDPGIDLSASEPHCRHESPGAAAPDLGAGGLQQFLTSYAFHSRQVNSSIYRKVNRFIYLF